MTPVNKNTSMQPLEIKKPDEFVSWFRSVAPYVHTHRGNTMVLHLSGDLLGSIKLESTIHDIALLSSLGIKLIISFGARPQIEAALTEQGVESHYVNGLRVTDQSTLQVIQQVVGSLQFTLLSKLSMKLPNTPMEGTRIQATSGNYVTAKPAGIIDGVDLQYTGHVRSIDVTAISDQISRGNIVLIPPLGYSVTGEMFDLSAMEVASQVANKLKANKLIFVFPYEGLQDDDGNMIKQLTQLQAEKLFLSSPERDQSPYAEIQYAILACKNYVERVHLVDQEIEGGILQELFTRDGVGTLLSQNPFDTIRKATSEDLPGILHLIEPLEKQGILVRRSREQIELSINDFTVTVREGTVIACCAIHMIEDRTAELACVAIHSNYRGQNRGIELFKYVEAEAKSNNVEKIFLLTTQAEHWFLEQGFVETSVEELPKQKQTLYNYSRNSKVLVKKL